MDSIFVDCGEVLDALKTNHHAAKELVLQQVVGVLQHVDNCFAVLPVLQTA